MSEARAIKFRAWDRALKQMFEVTKLQWSVYTTQAFYEIELMSMDGKYTVQTVEALHTIITNIYEIMWFTGLLDRNGREIYECDLLEAEDYWGKGDYAEVAWHDGQLQWWLKRNGVFYEPLRTPFADRHFVFAVIGNRYENPEFLECKEQTHG